jgi:DNA-binding transcriptional LysR family regulator
LGRIYKGSKPLLRMEDLAQHTLLESSHTHHSASQEWLGWRRWLQAQGLPTLEPQRWLAFNYAHQIVQAALTGQGVALARMPLVADSLASGDLVEVLPGHRMDTPMVYHLLVGPRSSTRPETKAFCAWLQLQAQLTRLALGEAA